MEAAKKPRRERGQGHIFKPRFRDAAGNQQECRHWRIQYYRHGMKFVENTKSESVTVAKELLKKRLGEIAKGEFTPPKYDKVRVEELAAEMLRNYRVNGLKSAGIAELKWERHLKPFFGHLRTVDVTTDLLNQYVEKRLQAGAENATTNREMAMLRRMFYLGHQSTPRKVQFVPVFPRLKENAPRKGFVTDTQYRTLCNHCTESWLRAMLAVAYAFGFRKGELLNMRTRQVDLLNRTIILDPGTTKNDEGRTAKMTDEVYTLLCECLRGKGPEDFVFTRNGNRPVRDFRKVWKKQCAEAEMPELLFHDLRRSAVRNMVRSGVPERVAMKISGHRTRAIFDRYNIVSEDDLADAARKIERGRTAAENNPSTTKVSESQPFSQEPQSRLTH